MAIKVLHAYRTYFPDPPGGVQEAIRQIALATKAKGIENTIYTLSPNPRPVVLKRPEGVVYRSKSWVAPVSCDIGGVHAYKLFRQLARAADLLFYQFPWPFVDTLNVYGGMDRPKVLLFNSDIVRQRYLGAAYAPLMWRTLRSVDIIVATSPAYAKTSPVLSSPELRKKVRVIPLGIDEHTVEGGSDHGVYSRLGLEAGEPYFLFVGVLRYYKGLQYLIEASKDVAAKIVIAGSGAESQNLVQQAADTGSRNILFAGQVTDAEKRALYEGAQAVVLPSHLRSEAFGMVLVEASMYGKPMISCEVGSGTSFVNNDGETGFVVEPASPLALTSAMNALLHDLSMRHEMGAAARQRYERLFSGPALGRAYAQLFDEVLS